ncbi:hypothetical protein [Natrinema amylolyticum]|uniref:hypothetical protein n=1 Tax=Natrinema amylolyticum TaxID=2878679 RepID=UPI001CFB18F4|nr:hypothetical protein [Natrinema amylolyticum]
MNTLSKLAVLFIAMGAVLMAGPVFGFSSFAADRGTTVNVPSDQSNAYLGVDNENDIGTLRGDDPPEQVATLFNNLNEDVDIIEFKIHNDSDALAVDSPNPGETIASGGSENVTVVCADSVSAGVHDIGVEIVEVDGATTMVSGVSFNTTVDIQCKKGSGSGVVNFQADDVGTGNTSQTFSFSGDGLKNNDEVYINVSDPQTNGGVDYTSGSPTVVSGAGTVSYNGGDQIIYDPSGGESGTVEIRMDGINVVGSSGERYTVAYSEQRKNRNDRDDSDIFYIID